MESSRDTTVEQPAELRLRLVLPSGEATDEPFLAIPQQGDVVNLRTHGALRVKVLVWEWGIVAYEPIIHLEPLAPPM